MTHSLFALLYGLPHSGKTTILGLFAKLIKEEDPEAVIRLLTAETYATVKTLLNNGTIKLWPIGQCKYPWTAFELGVEGFWPVNPMDPDSLLIPPDQQGDLSHTHYFIEGISSWSHLLFGSARAGGLASRVSRGETIGPVKKEIVSFMDGDPKAIDDPDSPSLIQRKKVGFNSGLHYGYVQQRMLDYILKSQNLPGNKIWTAHCTTGEDQQGKPIIGPKAIGTAATVDIPSKFGPVLYLEATAGAKGSTEYRVWLKQHFEIIEYQEWDGTKHTEQTPVVATIRPELEDIDKIPNYIVADSKGIASLKKLLKYLQGE